MAASAVLLSGCTQEEPTLPDQIGSIDGVRSAGYPDGSPGSIDLEVVLNQHREKDFAAALRKVADLIEEDDVGRDATVALGSITLEVSFNTFFDHQQSQRLAAIMPALHHETTVGEARVDLGDGRPHIVLDQLSVPAIRTVTASLISLEGGKEPLKTVSLTDGDHHFHVEAPDLRTAVAELDRLKGFLNSHGGELCGGRTAENGKLEELHILLPDHDGTAGPTRLFHDVFGPQPTLKLADTARTCSD